MGFKERNGRVSAKVIPNIQHSTLKSNIENNIAKNSIVCTDELKGYANLQNFTHLRVNHSAKEFVDGMASTNGIESFWALGKRGYYGIYHNFYTKHLQKYVDEFVFRHNEGSCKINTIERIKSLSYNGIGKRLTYKSLIQ